MRRFVYVCLALALVALPVAAQVQYGTMSGVVTDDNGQALPGVTVTLSGPAMQGTRTGVTDTEGKYRFAPVPPGKAYTLSFELSGFNTLEKSELTVNLGRDTAVNAEMSLSKFAETITVTADRVVVDTSKSTVDTTVDWDLMDTIPTARDYTTLMSLAPGVVPGNNPLVNGGSNDSNSYMIDGIDTSDPRTQTWGTALNFDAIAEVQLQTAGFQAEYGRATGGILNLVTKSGGNNFSFTGRYVKQQADWAAKRGIDSETGKHKSGGGQTDEARPIGALGGPIVKDALWFFLSYEERSNSRGFSYYDGRDAKLAGVLSQGRTSYKGHYFSGKLTFQLNPSHNFVAFYDEDPITLSPLERGWYGSSYDKSVEMVQFQGGDNSSLQWTGVLSPSFFMEAKYQYHRQELNVTPDSPTWNQVPYIYDYTAAYYYGGPWDNYQSKRSRDGLLLNGNYYLDTATGSHQFKAGLEYLGLKPETGDVYNAMGRYYVRYNAAGTIATPQSYYVYTDQSGATRKDQDYYALYLQDQWRIGKLTLNLGVRAESNKIMNNTNDTVVKFNFGDTIAPRLGFAYDLNGDVIRGSIGRFYQMPSNYISDYFQQISTIRTGYNWSGACAAEAGKDPWTYDPSCWAMSYQYQVGSSATLDPNLKPGSVDELSLGYEKRLSDQFAGGINFVYKNQKTTIDFYDPSGYGYYAITNVPQQARRDGYDVPDKIAEYQAVEVNLRKRFGPDGFQFLANYTYAFKDDTWTSSYRNVGMWLFTSPEAMNRLWYGKNGQRQYLKLAGSYTMPWKTVVGINATWDSGAAYTPYTYENAIFTAIPLAERGSLDVGSEYEASLYVEQPVKVGPVTLAVYANVFNAFNRQGVTGRSGNHDNSTTFKTPTAWQSPRSVQLGFKIEY